MRNREAAAGKEERCRPREGSPRERERRRDRKSKGKDVGGGRDREASADVESEEKERARGPKGTRVARSAAVPAEIVQDAAGNLHPFGLHDEDPQQEQRIPAPRCRGPRVWHGERAAAAAAPTSTRGGRGETRLLMFRTLSPGPPRLGQGAGRSPGSYAPFCLNGPMGSWDFGSLSALSQ